MLNAPDPVTAIRKWLAELGDAHTTLRPARPVLEFPYVVHLTRERALLHAVPEDSAGWRAGARPGMRLEGLDLERIWSIAGASSHLRPWQAGRVAMREPVEFIAGPRRVRWTESARVPTFEVTTSRPRAGVGLLRFDAFLPTIESELLAALDRLRDCELRSTHWSVCTSSSTSST